MKLYLAKSCISGSYNSPNVFIGLSSNSFNKERCVNIKILEDRNTTNYIDSVFDLYLAMKNIFSFYIFIFVYCFTGGGGIKKQF